MSVEVQPAELGFKRPFTHEVAQSLRLHNGNSSEVAFKVKTTAPKQYCVRPNSGRILPGAAVEVQVLLQAMKEDPAPDARCRDKFLVQSVLISADQEANNTAQILANIEQTAKSSVSEKKIRVTWLPADSASLATGAVGGTYDEPSAYSPPSPVAVTPQRNHAGTLSPSSQPTDRSPAADVYSSVIETSPQNQPALSSATAAIASVTGQSQDEVNRQLADAKAKISQLQAQLAEQTGLRQRKTGTSATETGSGSTATIQQSAAPSGVPVQYVFLLSLLSFLIAYLLF